MAKKIGYVFALLIQIILYAGSYVFNYFTVRKLGMNRYVVHLNIQVKEAVPIELILKVGLIVLPILMLVGIVLYVKNRKQLGKLPMIMAIVSVITTGLYAYYYLTFNVQLRRAHLVLSTFFLICGLIQTLKVLIACAGAHKEEK